jgi:hypothetical protein
MLKYFWFRRWTQAGGCSNQSRVLSPSTPLGESAGACAGNSSVNPKSSLP